MLNPFRRLKVAAAIAIVLGLVCAVASIARAAGSSAAMMSSNVVVVTNTSDAVNGNVSSVAALNARPGRDGISLREALTAANRTRGTATVYIMFRARLNGKTIELRSELPPIHRNHLVLEGIAPNGSAARVTLDGLRAPLATLGELLLVQASDVTVRWLRFTGVYPEQNPTGQEPAVDIVPGAEGGLAPSVGPQQIANVQIVDDVFDNRGITFPTTGAPVPDGLIVGNPHPTNVNTHISGITIARNTFLHYAGDSDAVGVWADDSNATVRGVMIEDNSFDQNQYAIELAERYNAPRIAGTRIIGNTITGNTNTDGAIGITLDGNATNGTTDDTLIEGNTISGFSGPAINLDAAAFGMGMPDIPGGDVISNTQIVNNVIRADNASLAGIFVAGGDRTASSPSRVSGLTIENDTLVNDGTGNLYVSVPNGPGASGNQVTDVTVRNSILYDPSGTAIAQRTQPVLQPPPDVVMNSLISGPGWAGTNGNITGDPLFVDEPHGDYHLAAGSPAINAGTLTGAPGYDFNGARRTARPDIGAYEYGAVPHTLLTITVEQLGGNGTVTSSPAVVTCGTTCSARFDPGTKVTLTAKPRRGSRFLGWGGACSSHKARCTITLNRAKTLTARFGP